MRQTIGVITAAILSVGATPLGVQPSQAPSSSAISEIKFSGRLKAGERFARRFGPDFEFVITPGAPTDGLFDNWHLSVHRIGEQRDLAALTLPLRGTRNQDIMAWHFQKTANAPREWRVLHFSPEVGTTITDRTLSDAIDKGGGAFDAVLARIEDFGTVDFRITDLELIDAVAFGFMAFDVRITWPASYRAGQPTNPTPTDVQLMRAARARSNKAIAAHDLDGIASVWMETIHVTSSTSAQTAGRAANRERMAAQFKNRPDTVYVRTPGSFSVYAPWDVGMEFGNWTGTWTEPDGKVTIGGTYLAQWRKPSGQWLIQSEVYVPLSCQGSRYCQQRP